MRCLSSPCLVAAAVVLAGCATSYSQIYGRRPDRAAVDTYPLMVIAVDGKQSRRQPVRVDPGLRQVTVQGPPTATSQGEQQTITVNVEPCTRYYLVAVKENRLSNDFRVKVDHQEPVPGCSRDG